MTRFIKGFTQELKTVKTPLDQKRVLSFVKRLCSDKTQRNRTEQNII